MIFELLRDVQARIMDDDLSVFKAWVEDIAGETELVLEHKDPGNAWTLINAAGHVFGRASWLDGCDSCGWGSQVTVLLSDAQQVVAQREGEER